MNWWLLAIGVGWLASMLYAFMFGLALQYDPNDDETTIRFCCWIGACLFTILSFVMFLV